MDDRHRPTGARHAGRAASGRGPPPRGTRRPGPEATGPESGAAGPGLPALAAATALWCSLSPPAAATPGAGPCEDGAGRAPFPPPLASPLEPRTRLAPVHVSRGARDRWIALVDLGERIPFWIVRPCGPGADDGATSRPAPPAGPLGPGPGFPSAPGEPAPAAIRSSGGPGGLRLAGSVAAAAFSRFDLEGNGNEFVEAHFRVGVRLRARLRDLEARLEAYHVSSHLGDEFLERTGRSPVSTSREGLELLVQAQPAGGLRVYGGPGVLVRSTEGLDRASLRAGAEWRGGSVRWGPFVPYVSAEAFSWAELEWDPLLAAEVGVGFGGGRYRLAVIAGAGPSRAEQFFREADEALVGLSLSADL